MFKKITVSLILYLLLLFIIVYFADYYYILREMAEKKFEIVSTLHNIQFKDSKYIFSFPYIGYYFNGKYILKKLIFDKYISMIIIIIGSLSLFWLLYIYSLIKFEEKKKYFIKQANLESLATQNSMQILTENIHHELNTPLIILERSCEKLKKISICNFSDEYLKEVIYDEKEFFKRMKEKGINKIEIFGVEKDLDYLKEIYELSEVSLEQIKNVLNNMAEFKHLKYSNGNKNLYELIIGANKIIKVIMNHDYQLIVDERFKNLILDHSTGMKNADFVNILLNHLKNSIEADSTIIEIKIKNISNKFTEFFIKDNGIGIPKNIRKTLFCPNMSSKDNSNSIGIRGNGMFINRTLLQYYKGDIKLYYTKEKEGTIFLLKIPTIKIS